MACGESILGFRSKKKDKNHSFGIGAMLSL
jgi:hypothetical protein